MDQGDRCTGVFGSGGNRGSEVGARACRVAVCGKWGRDLVVCRGKDSVAGGFRGERAFDFTSMGQAVKTYLSSTLSASDLAASVRF